MDITMGALRVCISWFLASHNKTIWNTVDLTKLQQVDHAFIWLIEDIVRPIIYYKHRVDEVEEQGLSLRYFLIKIIKVFTDLSVLRQSLMDLLIDITKLSRMAPKNLFFNFNSNKKKDLMFAAKRMPNIEKLALPFWCFKNKDSFRFVFSQWKNLKTLIIANDEFYTGTFEFQAVGENCSNLTNFKYLGYLEEDNAEKIVRYLQSLKRLSLRSSSVKTRGVLSLITGLKNLMILNLSHCKYSDLYLDMVPNDYFVNVSTQKLEKLIKCTQDCMICKDQPRFSRLLYHSEDWRNDEIEELEF